MIPKNTVLLVHDTADVSSRFLQLTLKREFSDYIDQLFVCGPEGVGSYDFARIDYVLSTVPISRDIPVPILQIDDWMNDLEISSLKQKLRYQKNKFLNRYYKKELFFTDIEGGSRQEIIFQMCRKIGEKRELPKGFYQSVMKREALGSTDLGYMSAIPHPHKILSDENIAAVAVLKKPVFWEKKEVQLVILSALATPSGNNNRAFFEYTTSLAASEEKVKEILKNPDFETFMELISI